MRNRKGFTTVTCTEPRPEWDSFYKATGTTYVGLCNAYDHLKREIERDEYVRYYSPVWIVNRRWLFRFKWARVAWYRFACWLWRKTGSKCKWPEGHPWHPLQTERIKAMGS